MNIQDTNFVQEIYIKFVTKRISESEGNLCIGDVKQSIYRFRQPNQDPRKYKTLHTRRMAVNETSTTKNSVVVMKFISTNLIFKSNMGERSRKSTTLQDRYKVSGYYPRSEISGPEHCAQQTKKK